MTTESQRASTELDQDPSASEKKADVEEQVKGVTLDEADEHQHYSQRAPWLRAGVLGAIDGLVSVASLMIGVGGGSSNLHVMTLAGLSGLVGGSLSMAAGEWVSVSSQRDSEMADVAKEKMEQSKGAAAQAHELDELAQIYEDRGISPLLARQVAEELTAKDVVKAHARDELGIDIDNMANPLQAALASSVSFVVGAGLPLLASAFIHDHIRRLLSLSLVSSVALVCFGVVGAGLGGANLFRGALRVLVGGWIAMGITYGIGRAFGAGTTT